MSWTDDRVDLLRKLWTDGLSASQIAAELGGVTRNAVIGKVHRLGLSGRAKGNGSSTARTRKPASPKTASYTRSTKSSGGAKASGAQAAAPRPAPIVDIPKPEPKMLNLLQLTDGTCKFPIGDPQEDTFGFCGAKPKEGDPYCEYHCRLAYQPASDRRKDRTKAPQQISAPRVNAS